MQKHGNMIKNTMIIIFCILAFISGAFFYISQLRIMLLDELRTSLSQMAESTGTIIEENIKNEINTISSIAAMLEENPSTMVQELIAGLNHVLKDTKFLRFGIADLEGNCYTTDDFTFNVANKPYFQASLQGKAVFSNTFQDVIGKKNINVFSAPIYHEEEITNVLFASIETNQLSDKLLIETYDDQGFSEVVNQDGEIIIQSESKNKKQQISSIAELNFTDNFQVSEMKYDKNGVAEFETTNGELRYLAYYRLEMNDWYILSIVPSSVVSEKINYFVNIALVTWAILAFVFTSILLYIYVVRIKADKKMEELVFYDTLTKHYNYNRFRIQTQSVLDQHKGMEYTLVEMDVKDFKMFNEFYGYQNGDHMLMLMMDACKHHCMKDETCSRIAADRFILLLHTQNEQEIITRMKQIMTEIDAQISLDFSLFNMNYKIGIYLIEEQDTEFSKCHDRCAYAKKQISNTSETFSFFSKGMFENQLSEKKMESLMEEALANMEFEVYLQPKVSLNDLQIHSAEALVRWNSPVYGLISPGSFIPLFERNGFLEHLDLYMVDHVCQILTDWKNAQLPSIIISINLSKVYLFKANFIERLVEIIHRYDIDQHCIEFEITESVIFDRSDELKHIIEKLKIHGFGIAMDDFGSGYSSLNMLKDIPIDVMKLDQEFFRFAQNNMERSKKIIESVIMLARGLHIHTVAEGVEHESEVTFLKEVGCDEIQGYYYSKPLHFQDFKTFYTAFNKKK